MEEIIDLGKRLADYVRMTIETEGLKPDSPIGIAYRDFMKEWDANKKDMICESCGTGMELTTWSCPKCIPKEEVEDA